MERLKRHKKLIIVLIVYVSFFIWYARLPDYKVHNSFITSYDNYVETRLKVKVNKAFFNPYLYTDIEKEHNRINRKPDKLIIELYFFKWKYRTVVFDYNNHIEYILIDYIYEQEE